MLQKVRVHELAKDLDMTSKDVIAILEQFGISVKGYMTVLEENQLDIIFESLSQKYDKGGKFNILNSTMEYGKIVRKEEPKPEPVQEVKKQKPKTYSPHPVYDHYGEKMDKKEACVALGLDEGKRYMLFFGLVRAYKGLDLLLDAFGKVKDELKDLQLIVAGEFYEDEDKYRRQISDNGLIDRVIIKNEFIADADLRKYFGAADLIVQPYKTATQSGVTQVAFHFEKPCLVTNVGGLGEIIHDGKMGYAADPQVDAIADSLMDYYQNDRQVAFTEYLIQEKKKYEWDKMTKAFYSL